MSTVMRTDTPKYLSSLLDTDIILSDQQNSLIYGVNSDSRTIQPGDLFFGCPGHQVDGRDYLEQAITHGAIAAVIEADTDCAQVMNRHSSMYNRLIPIVHVPQLTAKVGTIAARFYGNPSQQMTIIGVTGTNGKSSVVYFLSQALCFLHKSCGMIGTIGYGFANKALTPTALTTPDALTLQRYLAELRDQGASIIAMEVSSHGLEQQRLSGVAFDVAALTNISRDHLDYHDSIEAYAATKRRLFQKESLRFSVLNQDDKFGREWAKTHESSAQQTTYGYCIESSAMHTTVDSASLVGVSKVQWLRAGFNAEVTTPWGEGTLSSPLLGQFNLSNLLAALTVLVGTLEIPLDKALNALSTVTAPPGRMQFFGGNSTHPLVVVDYAHTPDALAHVLQSLRNHCQRKLWCVFGCGGERDRGKRALMGQIAERYSDELVITDDNPRGEDPQHIVNDIISQLLCSWAVEVEHDRRTAINRVIQAAEVGDVVLIAGKGHEDYQLIGGQRVPFSDIQHVQFALSLQD